MSVDEGRQQEAKSSVKISTTAAGKPLVEVKVYDGTDPGSLDAIREFAVNAYKQTASALGVPV